MKPEIEFDGLRSFSKGEKKLIVNDEQLSSGSCQQSDNKNYSEDAMKPEVKRIWVKFDNIRAFDDLTDVVKSKEESDMSYTEYIIKSKYDDLQNLACELLGALNLYGNIGNIGVHNMEKWTKELNEIKEVKS